MRTDGKGQEHHVIMVTSDAAELIADLEEGAKSLSLLQPPTPVRSKLLTGLRVCIIKMPPNNAPSQGMYAYYCYYSSRTSAAFVYSGSYQPIEFKAHQLKPSSKEPGRLVVVDNSGDSLSFRIKNEHPTSAIHVAAFLFSFDGARKLLYPLQKEGKTEELRAGEEIRYENQQSVNGKKPPDRIRIGIMPNRPNYWRFRFGNDLYDMLVVYATTASADYGSLISVKRFRHGEEAPPSTPPLCWAVIQMPFKLVPPLS